MHMALRRMAGWMQEMEREGEEGEIFGSQLCSDRKNSRLEAQKDILLLFFPQTIKRRKCYH